MSRRSRRPACRHRELVGVCKGGREGIIFSRYSQGRICCYIYKSERNDVFLQVAVMMENEEVVVEEY